MPATTTVAERGARPRALRSRNLEICPTERRVLADGRPLAITMREFETLLALAERRNEVVPRAELYALIWGGTMSYRDRSVDVFVQRVRKKLRQAAPDWTYIHTHFGVGYRLAPERRREPVARRLAPRFINSHGDRPHEASSPGARPRSQPAVPA
ncbi:MAG TPA: response regulator transcription factor [Solirubrobacteraceae bacterium]|jgi:DNA-binding response OmpR family regulator|nr:response regulator transcription factor [Solirubrobacteraceae bacterium]